MAPGLRVLLALGAVLFFLRPLATGGQPQSTPAQTVTFAQITDAHIFDDGWKRPTADAMRQAADDRTALQWAIGRISALVASGVQIDVVVYTGDLGLQNVDFPKSKGCQVAVAKPEPGVPLVPLAWAVDEVANELKKLAVRKVFFVPGNNDLVDENVTDAPRHDCFVTRLQEALKFSPLEVRTLDIAGADVNGIRFVGLNSASFKEAVKHRDPCAGSWAAAERQTSARACPDPQMRSLRAVAAERLVLFTHVPDLKDPYWKNPAWEIEKGVRTVWEAEACRPRVLGIFAGHFHAADRSLYGTTSGTKALALSCAAEKTWVAPPLAVKNQLDKAPRAQGFLLVTVTTQVNTPTIHWFEPQAPDAPAGWSLTARPWGWLFAAAVVFVLGAAALVWMTLSGREMHRDRLAVVVVVLFLDLALVAVWLARAELGVTDSATLIALLVLPLVLYGIVSGRLTEFTGPGGWGAKFREVAQRPVSPAPIDVEQMKIVSKEGLLELETLVAQGRIREDQPLVLKLIMGSGPYEFPILRVYLDRLSQFPNFALVIFVDREGRIVGYLPRGVLQRAIDLTRPTVTRLLEGVTRDNEDAVRGFAGMITETISRRTTNTEALQTMERLRVDALVVVEDGTGAVAGVVERQHILTQMAVALGQSASR